LAQSSGLLVLDEPFVGLDQVTADQLSSFLAQKISQGVGLILTSHITPMIDCKVLDLGVKSA
jgi:ABC-type multidrug transport system ATPase subunit